MTHGSGTRWERVFYFHPPEFEVRSGPQTEPFSEPACSKKYLNTGPRHAGWRF